MAPLFERALESVASAHTMPAWRNIVLVVAFVGAVMVIVFGLGFQILIATVQLRRFSRIFAGRPEAAEAYRRVLEIYGWRARLACRLFSIPAPPGFKMRTQPDDH